MNIQFCYIDVVELKDWLEKKYLEWQIENGRATVKDFASKLGISRSYLTLLLNGERTSMSREMAIEIAEKVRDYEILSILGYSLPEGISDLSLPPSLRSSFDKAINEIERVYKALGITELESPEALRIAKEIFEEHGWTVTT
jgi:transcriptional regulator with XRE-family HTH domain